MSTTQGSLSVQEQPPTLTFTPGQGERTTRVFKGPTAGISGQYSIMVAQGYTCVLRRGVGGVDMLEATIGGNSVDGGGQFEQPSETWSLFSNRVEKDLLETNNSAVSGISQEDKELIRKAIDNGSWGPAVTGDALEAYLLMLYGVRTGVVDQPVIRGSYLATAQYAVQVTNANVGAIFTNSQLESIGGVPGDLLIQLPSSSDTSYLDGTGDKPEARYGWRKNFPTSELIGADQFRVSVEYEYGLWAELLYADAS